MPAVNPGPVTVSTVNTQTPQAIPSTVVQTGPNNTLVLCQVAIPLIKPSSGTLTAAGALSAIVALPGTYSPGCWMYFPANAVATVSPAGTYWVVMSSTTAGTVYQNLLVGIPTILPPAVWIPCTSASSYTQVVTSDTVMSVPVPGTMGPNGFLDVYCNASNDLAAGTKNGACNLGGAMSMATFSQTTVNAYTPSWRRIANRGVTNVQVAGSGVGIVAAAGVPVLGNLDTTAAFNLTFQLQLATAATNRSRRSWNRCWPVTSTRCRASARRRT